MAGWRRSKCSGTLAQAEELQLKAAGAAKPFLHYKRQIFAALLKSSFSPWALHQRQKKICMLQVRLITGQSADRENVKALSLQPLISFKDCKFHCGGCTRGNPISPSVWTNLCCQTQSWKSSSFFIPSLDEVLFPGPLIYPQCSHDAQRPRSPSDRD